MARTPAPTPPRLPGLLYLFALFAALVADRAFYGQGAFA